MAEFFTEEERRGELRETQERRPATLERETPWWQEHDLASRSESWSWRLPDGRTIRVNSDSNLCPACGKRTLSFALNAMID
jgi:hypothetical protein